MPRAAATPAPWIIVVTTIVGFLGAMGVVAALEDTLIAGARRWPGGPTGFAVTLGFLCALGPLVVIFLSVTGKSPHRVGPRLRLGARATRWTVAVAGVVTGFALLVLLSSVPARSSTGAFLGGLRELFDAHAPGATATGLGVALLTLFVGALVIAGTVGADTPGERAALLISTCGTVLFCVLLIAALVSANLFEDDYFALAERWPGGPRVFLPSVGASVVLGVAGAVFAVNRRARLTRPGAGLLAALGIGLTTASFSVLFAAPAPRGYRGPVLCEEGFYCLLDQAHERPALIAGSGWLAVPVTGVLLGYLVVKVNRTQKAKKAQKAKKVADEAKAAPAAMPARSARSARTTPAGGTAPRRKSGTARRSATARKRTNRGR
ncbi:hypothetical protein RM844_06135 [Streptomyces sp. DSM 44915]|uniref:Integral membrane protein n=1 Tax=Streptomyces chisholmiae TaxID=3075540 RepID=A0ABU2JLQ7_9ACTN|nr:hypothetical protein [Streptomyces sp. DSM 44915]MDT0265867.1 hypothetical protein [Streptomyces sp. DSM 44915]